MKKTWKQDPGMSTTRERLARSIALALERGPVWIEDAKVLIGPEEAAGTISPGDRHFQGEAEMEKKAINQGGKPG